ncbi:DUF2948 family protein [Phaeovulum sp. W22_SRMD_FR3]|uniref:DUF2948 family protein n=1 Tax=Phaeovulum sp. W22_SRMD_FR3 TaxID=3240274 RepID=UPI003F989FEF
MSDARFEDGAESPLSLKAETPEDLAVMAALVQDAVLPMTEIRYEPRARRLALLVNRFRWEDRAMAEAARRPYERVQALLVIDDVQGVSSQGIDRQAAETILSVLSLDWQPGEDGTGTVQLTLAGDGAIAARVECLNLTLRDVTRPYIAPSGKVPQHPV